MSIIIELHGSRTFSVNVTGGKAKFLYYVSGNLTEAEAYALVLSTSPGTWNDYVRDEIDMNNHPTKTQWWPVVNYTLPIWSVNPSLPPDGTPPSPSPSHGAPADDAIMQGITVSTSLEKQRVFNSIDTFYSSAIAPFNVPDYKQLIGVSAGKVEGVEIGIPTTRLTMKRKLPYLSAKYLKNLVYMCGKTNDAAWWLFKPEDALIIGANGQEMGTGGYDISFEFDWIQTRYSIDVRGDGTLVVPEKRGHHYMWTQNFPEKDATANVIIDRPRFVSVDQVYPTVSFDYLGV